VNKIFNSGAPHYCDWLIAGDVKLIQKSLLDEDVIENNITKLDKPRIEFGYKFYEILRAEQLIFCNEASKIIKVISAYKIGLRKESRKCIRESLLRMPPFDMTMREWCTRILIFLLRPAEMKCCVSWLLKK
jgi:hypothetical protein